MRATAPDRFSVGRRLGVRLTGALALALFTLFFWIVAAEALGVVQSEPQGSPDDPAPSAAARIGASHPGEAVHVVGAFGVIGLAISGLGALIVRPERSGSSFQVLAAMTAVLLTLPLVGNPDNVGGQAGWIDPAFLILVVPGLAAAALARPWRHRRLAETRVDLLIVAAIAAVPAGWYGLDQALMQRNTFPPTADPHHNSHWWAMAVLAFTVVLVTAAAALPGSGRRLGPAVAGLAAVAVGITSLAASSSASAVGFGWAVAASLWGLATVWLTIRAGGPQPGAPDPSAVPPGG